MTKAAELAALIGSQSALSNRNIIINGAMNVSQRATSVTGVGGDADYKVLDRFKLNTSNTAGRLTWSQVAVTDLPGFANALKLDCTTADTSIAAGEVGIIQHRIEGQNLQRLKKGTSSAEPVTVSFYVKGNASATYTVELNDVDNDRSNSQTFSVTTSWSRVSLTYVGDTTGALDDDNANSIDLNIWFHAGSTFNSGTFSTTWTTSTNANRVSSSATSFFDSTDRTLEITGLQMEIGETATPFEHEDIGTTLAKCQRYYNMMGADAAYSMWGATFHAGSTTGKTTVLFPIEMRAIPTLGSSAANTFALYDTSGNIALTAISINVPSTWGTNLTVTVGSGLTGGQVSQLMANNNADSYLEFIAEL